MCSWCGRAAHGASLHMAPSGGRALCARRGPQLQRVHLRFQLGTGRLQVSLVCNLCVLYGMILGENVVWKRLYLRRRADC